MNRWLALSDGLGPVLQQGHDLISGDLLFDIAGPLAQATVLVAHGEGDLSLSLIHDPAIGFGLMLRHGARLVRHMLPTALIERKGPGLLRFRWDARTTEWSLGFADGRLASGQGAIALPRTLLAGAMLGARQRSPALAWIGLAGNGAIPAALIGPLTPVATPLGPVQAGQLRPGDLVLTRDHGPRMVLAAERHNLPARGSLAPIRLRAPFFGATRDILVPGTQQVLLTGVEVEYLTGEDQAMATAHDLADGRRAIAEQGHAMLPWIALDIGCDALLLSDDCALAVGQGGPTRRIDAFEMRALQTMWRGPTERSAA